MTEECAKFTSIFRIQPKGSPKTCGLCAQYEKGCALVLAKQRKASMNQRRINTDAFIGDTGSRYSSKVRWYH